MHTHKEDPAFPTDYWMDENQTGTVPGLTKREYFAAMALQGLLANSALTDTIADNATIAIQAADALIAKLNQA